MKNYYIVMTGGSVLQLNQYEDTPRGGILLIANYGTLFSNLPAANAAINRSVRYAKTKGVHWVPSQYRIARVVLDRVTLRRSAFLRHI